MQTFFSPEEESEESPELTSDKDLTAFLLLSGTKRILRAKAAV